MKTKSSKINITLLSSLLLLSFFVAVIEIPTAKAVTEINSYPYTISSGGSYVITSGGVTNTAYAITIHADNVFLDGANIQISGTAGAGVGVLIWENTNITLTNMNLTLFDKGVQSGNLGTCSKIDVENSTFSNCTSFGVILTYSSNSTVKNCNFFNNTAYSCVMEYGNNYLFDQCQAIGGLYGFVYDFDLNNCTIQNCNTTGLTGAGFISDGDNYDIILRNSNSTNDKVGVKVQNNQLTGSKLIQGVIVTNPTDYGIISVAANVTVLKSNVTISGSASAFFAGASGTNTTVQQCTFTGGTFSILDLGSNGNNTYKLNKLVNPSSYPVYGSESTNNRLLHSAYSGNSSNNNLSGFTVNDTSLGLVTSKVGNGTISPAVGTNYINGGNWTVQATATADAGFQLTSIVLNGATVGTSSPTTFEVIVDSTLETTFTEDTYPITQTIFSPTNTTYATNNFLLNVTASTNGTNLSSSFNVWNSTASAWVYGSNQTVTNGTKTGYINGTYTLYVDSVNDEGYSANGNVTFTIAIPGGGGGDTGDSLVVFRLYESGGGSITPTEGNHYYNVSDVVTLTGVAATNYKFMGWLENGTMKSTSNPYDYTVTGNVTITAIFYDPLSKESATDVAIAVALVFGLIAISVALVMPTVNRKRSQE